MLHFVRLTNFKLVSMLQSPITTAHPLEVSYDALVKRQLRPYVLVMINI